MELLSELIYILNRSYPSSVNDILPKGSKTRKLYTIISKGKVVTDEEAAKKIYKGSNKAKKYLMLKRNLVRTLSELVFTTNTFDRDCINYQKVRFFAKKELMIVEKLLTQNVYHNAEKIILKVKAYAEKFQLLDIQIECLKYLRTIYTLKGYPKEVELHCIALKRLTKFYQNEQDATGLVEVLESKTKYFIGKYAEIGEEARKHFEQILEWQKESASPFLKLYQHKCELFMYYHLNNAQGTWATLVELNRLLEACPFLKTDAISLFTNVEWCKHERNRGNLSQATVYIEKALLQCNYPAFNKFEVQGINFDLKIKGKNYVQAGKILEEVKKSQQFYLLESPDQAIWLLREAYLYFIFLSLKRKADMERYSPILAGNISVSVLSNSCKTLAKDKKGYNFMLVILKEALMRHKYSSENESGSQNLLVYYQRYMKDSCELRSRTFIKGFARLDTANLTDKKFRAEINSANGQICFDAVELVPYEDLFDLMKQPQTLN